MDQPYSAREALADFLGPFLVDIPGLGWALIAVVAVVFIVFIGAPLILLLLEQLVLLGLTIGGILMRVFLRRPWRVEARSRGAPVPPARYEVVGLRAARRARDLVARHIERTGAPPSEVPSHPPSG